MFGPSDTGEGEVNGQVLRLCRLQGKVLLGCGGVLEVKEVWTRVSQREQSLRKADKGRGRECASGGGISLEVAEMVSDDLLDVDAGGMV
eukprot:g16834.t1